MLVFKAMHLFVAASALLIFQPRTVAGLGGRMHHTPHGPNTTVWGEANEQDDISMEVAENGLAGRADDAPICVKVDKTFETSESYFFYWFDVVVPKDSAFTCSASSLDEGYLALNMYTESWYDGGRYCYVSSESKKVECTLGLPTETIGIYVEYFGTSSTTINVSCNNEPCTEAVCGDAFCSAGFETPVNPGPKTDATCKDDCGYTCGDGTCDPEVGEDETTCVRDCYVCAEVEETVFLEEGQTKEYEIELLDGEYVYCTQIYDDFNWFGLVTVSMKLDSPACFFPYEEYYWESNQPTPSPTSSYSPNYSPPCYEENDCNGYESCGIWFPANGTQTLYVTLFAPYGFFGGDFKCYKYPCPWPETNPPTAEPTSKPAASPTEAPVKSPAQAPISTDGADGGCFSKLSQVEVLGQGLINMDVLKIGDAVRIGDGSFSPVYSFVHYEPLRVAEFLQIWTTGSPRRPLEVTTDHLLYVGSNDNLKMVPASAVRVGDTLVGLSSTSTSTTVTSITNVQREGLYAPATMSGTIIVNGVAASNFVILPPAISAYLSFVQQHWLQYAALLPYRLYCGATGCQDEKYDQLTGLSPAVVAWLPVLHVTEFVLTWPIHLLMAFLGYYCFTKKQNDQKML